MNINILRYSLFGIAGGQEVDLNFSYIYYLFMLLFKNFFSILSKNFAR